MASTRRVVRIVEVPTTWTDVAQRHFVNVKTAYGAIGDGVTNDLTAIQNAIDAVAATGAGLFFPTGTYLIEDGTLTGESDLLMFGVGKSSKIKYNKTDNTARILLNFQSKNNIIISDLHFFGDVAALNSSGFATEFDHAIEFNACTNCFVQRCYIEDMPGDGVSIVGACVDINVSRNHITVTTVDEANSIGRNGIAVLAGRGLNISNNHIIGGFPAAIDLEPAAAGGTSTIQDVLIEGNYIYQPQGGIFVNASSTAGGQTITITDVTIANNKLNDTEDSGMYIVGFETLGTVVCNYIKIIGNTLRACLDSGSAFTGAMQFQGVNDIDIIDNTVLTSGKNGMFAAGDASQVLNNLVFEGNRIEESGLAGIFFSAVSGSEIEYAKVTNNLFKNNGQDAADTYSGFRAQFTDYLVCADNHGIDDQGVATQKYTCELTDCDSLVLGKITGYGNTNNPLRATVGTTPWLRMGEKALGPWRIANLGAAQATTPMLIDANNADVPALSDGYLIGVSVWSSGIITAGTLTVSPRKAAVVQTGMATDLDTTNSVKHNVIYLDAPTAFAKGDLLGFNIESDAALLPDGTADIYAVLWII
jgi:hypothetical protein